MTRLSGTVRDGQNHLEQISLSFVSVGEWATRRPCVLLRALNARTFSRKRHIWFDRAAPRLAAFTKATILLLELHTGKGERQSVIWWIKQIIE